MNRRAEEMLQAAQTGDTQAVAAMAADEAKVVHVRSEGGMTPLLLAVAHGHSATAEQLLSCGADANDENSLGQRPLHYAAYAGDLELLRSLLDAGAEPKAGDVSGTTALHYAGVGGSVGVVEELVIRGLHPSLPNIYRETPAHRAAQAGKLEALLRLQELGADLSAVDALGLSLAHKAATGNAETVLTWLHENGFSLDQRDLAGDAPLHAAASLGRTDGLRALLQLGQESSPLNHDAATPLHKAAQAGADTCVDLLLEHGADPGLSDRLGRSPLHWAAAEGQISVIERLAPVTPSDRPDDFVGLTPGGLAAYYGRLKAADRLSHSLPTSASLLGRDLKPGSALVWYLGNSGWAVRTQKHLLIFDYVPAGEPSEESSLANGTIVPNELRDQNVTFFVTHSHRDHYSPEVLSWREGLPGARFVLGGSWAGDHSGYVMQGQDRISLDGLDVWSIPSTDSGVGFMVRVDGLTLYHAGDHVSRVAPVEPAFSEQIDWLASHAGSVDLAFLPVFGCGFPSREGVLEGTWYSIERLQPSAVFPMHVAWTSYFYRDFAELAAERGVLAQIVAADGRGDRFAYVSNRAERVLPST